MNREHGLIPEQRLDTEPDKDVSRIKTAKIFERTPENTRRLRYFYKWKRKTATKYCESARIEFRIDLGKLATAIYMNRVGNTVECIKKNTIQKNIENTFKNI